METQISMTSMCQGSRMLGMSKIDEHNLESYFRKLVANNGYEFVIDKLKTLKQHTINKIQDPDSCMPKLFDIGSSSIKWNRSKDEPKGPLSLIYSTWSKPTSRLAAIGSLIQSLQEDAISPKQYKKFKEGINHNGRDADNHILYVTRNEAVRFMVSNKRHLSSQKMINGTDLTASLLPAGVNTYSIKKARNMLTSHDDNIKHEGIAKMSYALDQQWQDCPKPVKTFIKNKFKSFKDVKPVVNAGKVVKKDDLNPHVDLNNNGASDYYAGTMSVLQKPGGKLRTVFNTNRVINYALTPYGDALEDAFYKAHPHHIFVKRQDKGLSSIQQMVRHGRSLVSADLSSATDRLNFRAFTNGLRKSMINCFFSKDSLSLMYPDYFTQDGSDRFISILTNKEIANNIRNLHTDKYIKDHKDKPDKTKYLPLTDNNLQFLKDGIESINLFERVAQMSFYSTDLQAPIALKTGQPLGMMGSFQTLTSMNFCMGRQAELKSTKRFEKEIPSFAVVGDDFVGDESIMDEYSNIVEDCRGKDNHEKALHSHKYAEFLSHFVSRDRIIPIKPRFKAGAYAVFLNAEKSSVNRTKHVYRLSERTKQQLEILASVGDPVQTGMTTPATSQRRNTKVRNLVKATEIRLSLIGGDSPDPIKVSKQSVSLSRDVTPKSHIFENKTKPNIKVKSIHNHVSDVPTQYKDHVNDKIPDDITNKVFVKTENGYKEEERPVPTHENEQYSPVTDHYDHHTAKRTEKQSLREQYYSSKRKADTDEKILNYIDKGKDSDITLPYHTNKRKISEVITDAEQIIGKSEFGISDPYPSALENNDRSNEIDRTNVYKDNSDKVKPHSEDLITQMIQKGLSPDQIMCISDYTEFWQRKWPSLNKKERGWLTSNTSSEFTDSIESTTHNAMIMSNDNVHTEREKDNILMSMHEHTMNVALDSLPESPSSYAWYEFHGSSSDTTHLKLQELKDIGPMVDRSSLSVSSDHPDLGI